MKPTLASFFSGIGGVDLGFVNAGFRLTMQCEIDKYCRSVLEAHWPKLPRFTDIKEITDADVPVSDVWAGGFPCQDVSLARMGPRAGLKGKKSGLFHEFARLLENGRPRVFLIENVPGLLSSHRGRDFELVLRTLAGLGYGVGWRVLNSRYFGVAQSRQRVYIVGCHRDPRGPGQILFESECGQGDPATSGPDGAKSVSPFKERIGDPRKGPITPSLAYCLYACSARHTGTDWSRNYVSYPTGRVRRLLPIECERLQGFPEGWTIPEKLEINDPDKVDTLRYHALGNAVTVPVAEWLAGRIKAYLATANKTATAAGVRHGHAKAENGYSLLSRSTSK
ncbi:MAG: DNA (cytosine-5-)-methyltransferase [Bryobacteraceae bacterium]|nr:DNA (cytosine-5-)-methyltransferase [Bryobacteraceae bacterium]